jgi:adenosylmethionine-8-amino-7-oxononanoate aminotransferase
MNGGDAEWGKDHIINAYYAIGQKAAVTFEKGYGVILQDTTGKEYIDTSSQLTCVNLGYGRKELIDAAAAEMNKLQFIKLFHGYYNPAIIQCAQRLTELTPEGLDNFFFTGGGSESTEMAFQIARLYWHNKGKAKHKIISLYDSYHGITLGAVTASGYGKGNAWRGIGPLPSGFIHIPSYDCYYCMFGREYPSCSIQCARFLEETIVKEGPDSIAAFIAEPVLGVGGMIPPPPEFWPLVREICTKYDVLLIADEVMTGFCRTGKMFATEHWGIKPDLMTMAKGLTSAYLPLAAVAFRGDIFDALKGRILPGFTYGGHPVAAAVAVKAMEIYVKEKLAENAAEVGKHVLARLNAEFKPFPHVDNISGLGLMIGFNLVKDKATKVPVEPRVTEAIVSKALDKGLLIRCMNAVTTSGTRVAFTPPLIVSVEEADRALDILLSIIADLKVSQS